MFWLILSFIFNSPGLSGKFDYLQGSEFTGFFAVLRDPESITNYSFHNVPWFQAAKENVIRKDFLNFSGIHPGIPAKTIEVK